jgi:N-acetylglucosamine kinase-like BadF-type ATPase
VLAAIDGRGPATQLTPLVTAELVGEAPLDPDAHTQALIGAAYAQPPAALGRLAPLVNTVTGDQVANVLVSRAADRLLHSLTAVNARRGTLPPPTIVVAGAVLLGPGPVGELVRAGIRERFGVEPLEARDGAAGAAALAIGRLTGRKIPAKIHARLTGAEQASITS